MLPDLSPAHILIVIVVALIVVGPKDLPMLLRKIGQFMGKMRTMANEFRSSFDEMARQSELDELRKEVEAMRNQANEATQKIAYETDFGATTAHYTDAEGKAMDEWMGTGAPVEHAILPPPEPAKKTRVSRAKAPADKAAPAKSAPAKGRATKVAADKPPAKPRAKKAKSAAESKT